VRLRLILTTTCLIFDCTSIINANPYKARFLTEPVIMPAEERMSMLYATIEFGEIVYTGIIPFTARLRLPCTRW